MSIAAATIDETIEAKLLAALETVDPVALTTDLVAIQSHREISGHETPCALFIKALLEREGIETYLQEVRDGRCNVIGILRGKAGGPTLMYNGHIDTVPPGAMPEPFTPRIENGLLYGRGTVDMKGGVAGQICAMIAIKRAGIALGGDLILSGVIAEEDSTSLGSLHIIEHGPKPDMVVVSEPTGLDVVTAHKGFDYYRIDVHGRANHSSRPDKGISALYKGAKIVNAIESRFIASSCARSHPLLGHASLNTAAMLSYANNEAVTVLRRAPGDKPPGAVVPDICTIYLDRRRIPGETLEGVMRDFEQLLAELKTEDPELDATASFTAACPELPSHPPLNTNPDYPLVTECVRLGAIHAGSPSEAKGVPFWSDAALFNDHAGIPAIVFGPGHVEVAHSNHEHVPVDHLTKATRVFALLPIALLGSVP